MRKGILLELEGRKAIVLTPEGEFKRVPAPRGNPEIGAEIEFAESRPFAWSGLNLVAAAAALLLILVPGGYFGYNAYALAQPVALVSVDINPSLQFTLNKQGDVLKGVGLNEDGKAVLQGIDLSHRPPLADVMADVTQRAIAAGKLNPTDDASAVVVAVAPTGAQDLPAVLADQFAAEARSAVEKRVAEQAQKHGASPRTHVAALEATAQEEQEAAASGLTPGQWLLLQEIQAQFPDVKPDQLKAMGPGKLIHSLGANPGDVFSQAEEHHGSESQDEGKNKNKAGEPGKAGNSDRDKGKGQDGENGKGPDKSKAPDQGQSQEPGNGKGQGKGSPRDRGPGQGQNQGQSQGQSQVQQGRNPGQGQDQNRGDTPSRGEDRGDDHKGDPGQGKGRSGEKERGKSQSQANEENSGLDSRADAPGVGASLAFQHGKKGQTP